jgi:hypothetical protein
LYKYPNGKDYEAYIYNIRVRIFADSNSAESAEKAGLKDVAETYRKNARSAQEYLATLESAQAYIDAVRVLNTNLTERILQDSQ